MGIKPEITLQKLNDGSYMLLCSMQIPEREAYFSDTWRIQPTTNDQWSLYQEITALIGKCFETIRKDIKTFRDYEVKNA